MVAGRRIRVLLPDRPHPLFIPVALLMQDQQAPLRTVESLSATTFARSDISSGADRMPAPARDQYSANASSVKQ
jgi:hypothetical protein